MVTRRVLLPLLVAAFVLLGSGQALAAPTWLAGESQEGTDAAQEVPADVATDSQGNSMAVWVASGEIRAAYRPRGGPWGAPESLDGEFTVEQEQPRVVVLPNGEFNAVWTANDDGSVLRWARHSPAVDWTAAATIGGAGCCGIAALLATADGSVTLIDDGDGFASSYTKNPGSAGFEEPERLPSGNVFAAASDGSVVAVRSGFLCSESECVVARHRPPGGPWPATDEVVSPVGSSVSVNGLAVTANPDSSYTAVWAESSDSESPPTGSVLSSDRAAGDAGTWAASRLVADVPDDRPGCGGCVDVSTGPGGTQLALWKEQAGVMRAALRGGTGADWGAPETAGDAPGFSQPHGAVTAVGVPVAAWDSGSQPGIVTGTHREGGSWHPVELTGGPARGGLPAGTTFLGDLAADGQGDALTAWRDTNGIQTAGFDAAAPRFDAFALPAGAVGSAPFSAAASDNWSGPASIGWFFGDGASASGASVSHTYPAPGTYNATAQATDGVGNASTLSGSVTVTAPPPTCGTGDADKDGVKDGCDESNGAQRPKAFKTVNATVVSGEVFVKLPAGAGAAHASAVKAPKGFKRLQGAETIPVGATLDTAHGRVKVRSAADTKAKKLQSGQFFSGRFSIRQARIKKRSKKLITELRLSGSSFKKACKAKAKASISAKKKSKKRVRRLFGNAKGSFRTSGRNAAATVRGTRWGVQDRCDGTLVTVQRGRVEVRDKVKRKTIIVRTGHKYLARAR